MHHPISKWPARPWSQSLYPGYKSGLKTPIQHKFSLELAHCSNSVSHSSKLYLSPILSHVWKFFSNLHLDHDNNLADLSPCDARKTHTHTVKVTHSCPTLGDPMDYTVYEILQARILECEAIPFSRDLPNPEIELRSPSLQMDSLPAEPQMKPKYIWSEWKVKHNLSRYVGCI